MGRTRRKSGVRKTVECIMRCLDKRMYPLILKWKDKGNKKFSILFKNKKSYSWTPEYLEFFKEMDRSGSVKKHQKYQNEIDADQACKRRCKANLRKLCNDGVIEFIEKKDIDKCTKEKYYKFTDSPANNETNDVMTLKAYAEDEKLLNEIMATTDPQNGAQSLFKQDQLMDIGPAFGHDTKNADSAEIKVDYSEFKRLNYASNEIKNLQQNACFTDENGNVYILPESENNDRIFNHGVTDFISGGGEESINIKSLLEILEDDDVIIKKDINLNEGCIDKDMNNL